MPVQDHASEQENGGLPRPLDTERLLRSLGVTGRLRGFRYTVYMVERIRDDPSQLHLITKRLYPDTADQFQVSADSVERNLRTLIHICWKHRDHTELDHVAGTRLTYPPTNMEFLDIVAGYLRQGC